MENDRGAMIRIGNREYEITRRGSIVSRAGSFAETAARRILKRCGTARLNIKEGSGNAPASSKMMSGAERRTYMRTM